MPKIKNYESDADGVTIELAGDNPKSLAQAIKDFGNAVSSRRGLSCSVTGTRVRITVKVQEGERQSVEDFVKAQLRKYF